MIRILILLIVFINFKSDEPVLAWNESYKLSWKDFKAKPNKNDRAVAITASGITFGYAIRQTDKNNVVSFSTDVHAHFYPEQSWYKPEKANDHILFHEQLHFDITELYARKFRYRISQLKVSNNVKTQLKQIHNDINKALSEMQSKYDNETDYSRNFDMQSEWKIFIYDELATYSQYVSVN